MTSTTHVRGYSSLGGWRWTAAEAAVVAGLRPLQALLTAPAIVLMAALTAMLFRPPDLKLYDLDRIGFILLLFIVCLRAQMRRQSFRAPASVLLPMGGLLLLAVSQALSVPYDAETWSVLAAKWLVPLGLFYAARLVFEGDDSLRRFETFALVVFGYLCVTAVLFLFDVKILIFPPFILDQSLGVHAERARGPFLQAVANGVTLNLLGLIALDSFRRARLRGLTAAALLATWPLAILATKTRAVWASFGASVLLLLFFSPHRRIRRACLCLVAAASLGLICAVAFEDLSHSLRDRLEERSPVQFRMAVYRAGWEMFREKPLAGWGPARIQAELARRVDDFHGREFYFHNTFIELGVEYGLIGLALYLWLVFDLLRLGRSAKAQSPSRPGTFLDVHFRSLWPVFLGVYLLNACFVVMNYQFVNGLLFTVAGILTAQNQARDFAFSGGLTPTEAISHA